MWDVGKGRFWKGDFGNGKEGLPVPMMLCYLQLIGPDGNGMNHWSQLLGLHKENGIWFIEYDSGQ